MPAPHAPARCGHRLGALLAAVLLAGLAGCKTVVVEGEPWVNQAALAARPPYSLAILPTVDAANHPELREPVRLGLYEGLAALAYQDVPLARVDEAVTSVAERLGRPPDELPPGALALPALADCVIFTEIANVSRLYLILYARTRIDLNFVMMDTRTRAVLYRNRFAIYSRIGGPTVTILGLIERAVQGLWNLRGGSLPDALVKAGRQIGEQIPQPNFRVADGPALQISDATLGLPRNPLGVGDTLTVRVTGTPHTHSTFSISRLVREAPLREVRPGVYEGSYTVKAGDDTAWAVATVRLRLPAGESELKYVIDKTPLAIDTRAPAPPKIEQWWNAHGSGLYLAWRAPAAPPSGQAPIVRYLIYRRAVADRPATGAFALAGQTDQTSWRDPRVLAGRAYEYYLQSEDAAGNRSAPGPVSRITAPAE